MNVDSERELSSEIERAAARLDPSKEWTDRVAAMVRLEALLLGGAAEWDCFPGLLGKLRGPLTAQVADRRSSIVRQAAHLLVVLAAELGGEFEKEAAHYVPELFKCVVITVQIIAESGDLGVQGILHNCQARPSSPGCATRRARTGASKLRCQATGWLRLVVREWDDACLGDRGGDCVEEAILSMVKDGSNDVRAGARAASRRTPGGTPTTRRARGFDWTPTPGGSSRRRARRERTTATTTTGCPARRRCTRERGRTRARRVREARVREPDPPR